MNVRGLLQAERAELVELLRSLSDAEWETPSLCAGWSVRDVVCHLQTDAVSLQSYLLLSLRNPSIDRTNQALIRQVRTLSNAELIDRLAAADGWFSRYLPRIALADNFVHQQDIRRPLGRERTVPEKRLRAVLGSPDPFALPWRNTHGLRWEATDIQWSKGSGPLVRGPGEALALAMVGRPVALDDLRGDGVAELRRRLLPD
ncbi:maleylpyruvate isomerase family mycothiol-dependent enzyme [Nocardia sp. 2]|uniref:Maleylpyruvate isomerase family mycothiol-dependent enzyme n=1 Tax=Nocardia acididurans TaxID=2802282 RepID=A0ABS1MBG4_9NOCA|nr:maleylpyruvate isomerase family mycothiol-dependent enzyme [Nocardia acididurans]MBL1077894.1 maleylpyruvate isomerase family mycothiol-dependent enzyme [Nocardia acididurans]